MADKLTTNLVNILILSLLPIYISIHIFLLPPALSYGGIADAGFVSIITLTFLGCAFLTVLTLIFNPNLSSSRLTLVTSAYVILIYFLREADFHRLFTEEHVTRGAFYTMASVPLWQKIISAIVFLLLAASIVFLLYKHSRSIINKVRIFEPWAIALLFWIVVFAISQLCDKSGLNDRHFGRVIEECCECWAAIFLFLCSIQVIPTLGFRNADVHKAPAYN